MKAILLPATSSSWTRDAIRATARRVPIRPSTRLLDMRPGRVGDLIPIRRQDVTRPRPGVRYVPATLRRSATEGLV